MDNMLRRAELVFEGTVTDVQYRLSTEDQGHPATPYTFITYRINALLKGNYSAGTITLRFLGGLMAPGAEEFLSVPHHPLFDVGDHDVLLVAGNTEYLCPLVNCARGRFRYVDGLVVNEEGQTIQFSTDGSMQYGPAVNLKAVNTHRMSDSIYLESVEVLQEGEQSSSIPPQLARRTTLPDPATFTAFIQDRVQHIHTPEELAAVPAVVNADADKPFIDKTLQGLLTPSPPPEIMEGRDESEPADAELEMMVEELYRDRFMSAETEEERQKIREEIWARYPQLNPYETSGAGEGKAAEMTSHNGLSAANYRFVQWPSGFLFPLLLSGVLVFLTLYRRNIYAFLRQFKEKT